MNQKKFVKIILVIIVVVIAAMAGYSILTRKSKTTTQPTPDLNQAQIPTQMPSTQVSFEPIHGTLLRSLNSSGTFARQALYPCANNVAEVRKLVNEYMSDYIVKLGRVKQYYSQSVSLISNEGMEQGFEVSEENRFFKVRMTDEQSIISALKKYYPSYSPERSDDVLAWKYGLPHYVCNKNYLEYINTAGTTGDEVYYPYEISANAIDGTYPNVRILQTSYLRTNYPGLAEVSKSAVIDRPYLEWLMNLAYNVEHFSYGGGGRNVKIINRSVRNDDGKWIVEDQVETTTSCFEPPCDNVALETNTNLNVITVDTRTGIVN